MSTEVREPAEYKEAVEAAEVLGLELSRVDAYGYGWDAADDTPVDPGAGSSEVEIVNVGRKYFHMRLNGPDGAEVVRVRAGRSRALDDRPAKLVLRFDPK